MNGYSDNVVANNKEENLLQNGYDNNEVTSKGKIDIDIGIVDDLKKLHVNDAVYQNGDKSSSIELNADKIFPSTDDKNTNNTQKSKDNKFTESSTITNGTPDENITKDSSAETNTKEKQRVLHFDHPVYKKISAANGIINRMHRDQLLTALDQVGLSKSGSKEVLLKRLKTYCKKQHLKENNVAENKRALINIDYYVLIDFEATCEEVNPPGYEHEIIEFPAVLVKTSNWQIVSEFTSFCRPVINPTLSEFCKKLTTIKQIQVDTSPQFETVLRRFDEWLKQQITPKETFAVATDGPWDLDRFIRMQCRQSKLQIPHYFLRWVNVRKHFVNYYKMHQVNMELMLQHLGMDFEGTPHRGIDDARNLARILKQLHLDGADLFINEFFR